MLPLKSMAFVLALGGATAAGSSAGLAQACGAREQILKTLAGEYKEAPAGMGLAGTNRVVELLVSKNGTWTLIATGPGGTSCLIAAGENWESVPILVGERS
jgi:hypothetical protein